MNPIIYSTMKQTLLFAACAVSLLFCSCSDNNKGSDELEPTIANLAGTWKAETYKLNGNEIPQSRHPYDYITVGKDGKYTARFGLLDALANQGGYCYGPGAVKNRMITLLTNSVSIKTEVMSLTQNRLAVKNAEGYEQIYSRVANPTLYRVANKTTFAPTELTVMLTMAVDANGYIVFQAVHGFVPDGQTCEQVVYTPMPKAMHVVMRKINGTTVHTYISRYPQKMTEGSADNVIFMADTTIMDEIQEEFSANLTKVDLSNLPAKPLSEWLREGGR